MELAITRGRHIVTQQRQTWFNEIKSEKYFGQLTSRYCRDPVTHPWRNGWPLPRWPQAPSGHPASPWEHKPSWLETKGGSFISSETSVSPYISVFGEAVTVKPNDRFYNIGNSVSYKSRAAHVVEA